MIGRENHLALCIALLESGSSVDVVGSRGSGRSAMLRELRVRLEARGWTVVSVQGVASLRNHPVLPLRLAGATAGGESAIPLIERTARALREMLPGAHAAILIDDWDDLDETTWGLIESIRRLSNVPIVLSRLAGQLARHTPTGLKATTAEPAFVIDTGPLSYFEMEAVLQQHLGAPVSAAAASRFYERSGGVIGLALSMVDAAVHERRIHRDDGVWVAHRDVWSPTLRGVVETYLDPLSESEREALEVLALVGVVELRTAKDLVDAEVLEQLEAFGMIQLQASGSRQLVTVMPPLVVEMFHHSPLAARRERLTERIAQQLGMTERLRQLRPTLSTSTAISAADAVSVRMLKEHNRSLRIVAEAEWQREKSVSTALPLLGAMLADRATRREFEAVLAETPVGSDDEYTRVEWAVALAAWRVYMDGDVDGALDSLRAAQRENPVYGRGAAGWVAILSTYLRDTPEDFADQLEVSDELPQSVRTHLWGSQMIVLLARGRFADARRAYDSIDRSDKTAIRSLPNILHTLLLLGEGDHAAALAWARSGFDEAQGAFDAEAARGHAYGAALCLTLQGDYAAVDKILTTVLSVGELPQFPLGSHLGILVLQTIAMVRSGRMQAAERYARAAQDLPGPDGPFPGQSRAWSRTVTSLSGGESAQRCADGLWHESLELWNRGARFGAALGMLFSLEMHSTHERLEEATTLLSEMDGLLVVTHLAFLRARHDGDAEGLVRLAPDLRRTGQPGIAVTALETAIDLHRGRGEQDAAERVSAILGHLRDGLEGVAHDKSRFEINAQLTARELEIAQFVAMGMTNQQIATRLVLSVRTVESHLLRTSRKLGVKNRGEIAAKLAAHTASPEY
ncbi:LuxR C-terminal-related transcriptional regulator [Microbacterium sp. NPDC089695]|uniref:LuxR C-terminal-related transcriptional regulator n=1 Tax=Microbacterium sp. NPDC089695 TaxID=3364198 RepID=UPI00382C8C33